MPSEKRADRSNQWLRDFDPWVESTDDTAGEPRPTVPTALCQAIFRFTKPRSAFDELAAKVAGIPVHVETVLSQPGTQCARFCFSSYMYNRFHMYMMNRDMIMDPSIMSNLALDISETELQRCTDFMRALEGKSYNYFDAFVLVPVSLLSKSSLLRWGSNGGEKKGRLLDTFAEDVGHATDQPQHRSAKNLAEGGASSGNCKPDGGGSVKSGIDPKSIQKVFCSQSVVLMLRNALDPSGSNAELLGELQLLNSRTVSPKQVCDILLRHGAKELENEELLSLAGLAS